MASKQYRFGGFGQVLLHMSSGETPLATAANMAVWHGGATYNVIYAVSRVFGEQTLFVTANVNSELGRLLQNRLYESGSKILTVWKEEGFPGPRVPMHFTDHGAVGRPPTSTTDRNFPPLDYLVPADIDWTRIFRKEGVERWHFDGITVGSLSRKLQIVSEMLKKARAAKTIVSYDLNPRRAIWERRGGFRAATRINMKILPQVDVLFCGIGSLFDVLGFPKPRYIAGTIPFETSVELVKEIRRRFPNLKVVAASWKNERNLQGELRFGAIGDFEGQIVTIEPVPASGPGRIGTGDSFAAGTTAGLIRGLSPQDALKLGHVHALHKITTAGDLSRATLPVLEQMMRSDFALSR